MADTYVDGRGYKRYKDSDKLVHRHIAYKYVYSKERDKYNKPFSSYEIHHKNGNKLDNRKDNLELLLWNQHESEHSQISIPSSLRKLIKYIIIAYIILAFLSLLF